MGFNWRLFQNGLGFEWAKIKPMQIILSSNDNIFDEFGRLSIFGTPFKGKGCGHVQGIIKTTNSSVLPIFKVVSFCLLLKKKKERLYRSKLEI